MNQPLALPVARNGNRLPYYVERHGLDGGPWWTVTGPTPNEPQHVWTCGIASEADTLADSLNAAWQCGRRTGSQDLSLAKARK
jgi:hypothetical protein